MYDYSINNSKSHDISFEGGYSKRDLYTRVNTIVLSDAGTNEVNGTYSNENGRYLLKVEPDRSYEIRKIMDDEDDSVWWDIARCDRNGIEEVTTSQKMLGPFFVRIKCSRNIF